jgi:riboflavin biosynthesis pyrimidine reductase
MRDTISRAYPNHFCPHAIIKTMKVSNDYPNIFSFDSRDTAATSTWWDTLGDRWVRVNLITDCLGNTVGDSRSSGDLTGGADRELLSALRTDADVILLGGETVRTEADSIPRNKDVVIVSKSGNVPLSAISRARGRITILHDRSASVPSPTTGVVLGRFTGTAIIKAVRALGYEKIVCEGGSTLARNLLDAQVVDEWCQTLSPKLGRRIPELLAPDFGGTLVNVAHDDHGYRYLRWTRNGAPQVSN